MKHEEDKKNCAIALEITTMIYALYKFMHTMHCSLCQRFVWDGLIDSSQSDSPKIDTGKLKISPIRVHDDSIHNSQTRFVTSHFSSLNVATVRGGRYPRSTWIIIGILFFVSFSLFIQIFSYSAVAEKKKRR